MIIQAQEKIVCKTDSCPASNQSICNVENEKIMCSCDAGYVFEGNNNQAWKYIDAYIAGNAQWYRQQTGIDNRGTDDAIEAWGRNINDIEIYNNTFRNWHHTCLELYALNNTPISQVKIHHNLFEITSKNGTSIQYSRSIGYGASRTTGIDFFENWSEGMMVNSQVGGHHNLTHHNAFLNTTGGPTWVRHKKQNYSIRDFNDETRGVISSGNIRITNLSEVPKGWGNTLKKSECGHL